MFIFIIIILLLLILDIAAHLWGTNNRNQDNSSKWEQYGSHSINR